MAAEGTQFGRYVLLRKIAAGGMAEIFLAKQTGPGHFERSLVIKRILPHLAQDPKFVGMFLDEAALAAQLSHPHIAQLFDFGEVNGAYYLALELVRGPDLATIIDASQRLGRPPPVEISVRIATQMLEALHYAHGATDEQGKPFNLVHRDVSPQNVLVSANGAVKLIDFGIAKAASAMQHTETGMVKGKFTYMAPEQLRGKPLDGRCDLYASALVLYEMLTLQLALQGEGPAAIANALEARIRPIEELRPDLPADLVAAMTRALRRDREERFRDCAEFSTALEAVLASKGAMVQSPQIAEFLKSLELEAGHPLSPIGPGSGSGEKVSSGQGSGPHDTAISVTTPPVATATALGTGGGRVSAPSPSLAATAPVEAMRAGRHRGFRVAAFLLGLTLVAATAMGWRWWSVHGGAAPDATPEASAAGAPLPPLPEAKPTPPQQPSPPPTAEAEVELPPAVEPAEGPGRRERSRPSAKHHAEKPGVPEPGSRLKSGGWAPYQAPPTVLAPSAPARPSPPTAGYGYGYHSQTNPYQPQPYQRPAYYYQPSGYCQTGYYRNGYYCYRNYYPQAPAPASPSPAPAQ